MGVQGMIWCTMTLGWQVPGCPFVLQTSRIDQGQSAQPQLLPQNRTTASAHTHTCLHTKHTHIHANTPRKMQILVIRLVAPLSPLLGESTLLSAGPSCSPASGPPRPSLSAPSTSPARALPSSASSIWHNGNGGEALLQAGGQCTHCTCILVYVGTSVGIGGKRQRS